MSLTNKILQSLQEPKNRELVNEGQDEFICAINFEDNKTYFYGDIVGEELIDACQFRILTWCIKLLPEFQTENPYYIAHETLIKEYLDTQKQAILENPNMSPQEALALIDPTIKQAVHEAYIKLTPKTVSEALLKSGAMTVEELEEEYKKLIN